MTLVLVLNYGFLSSFKNVLPNLNLLPRKSTFRDTAAKAVTFEVASLLATSDWNEIRLALASSEKKVVFVSSSEFVSFDFRVRVNSAPNGYFARFELHDKHSKQLYANFRSATCEIKQSSSSVLGPFCHSKLCFIYFQMSLKGKEDVYF